LQPGLYTGLLLFQSGNGSVTIPVSLVVGSNTSPVFQQVSALNFTMPVGGPNPSPQTFTVASTASNFGFGVSVATVTGGNWLKITGSYCCNTTQSLTVSVDGTALSAGIYSGQILFANGNTLMTVPVTLTVAGPTTSVPSINNGGVVNVASYAAGAPVAPGSIAAVFGNFLISSTSQSSTLPLPTRLSGVSLQFGGGVLAPLFFVSSGQSNIQVPWELAGQKQASLAAVVNGQTGTAVTVSIAPFAPGIFSTNAQGTGQGAILDSSYKLVDSSNPATAGSTYIQIYCTGLGAVSNQPASGAVAPSIPLAGTTTTPTVTIGGVSAQVQFSGLAPGFVGVYQVNVQVPAATLAGNAVPVVISIGGAASNTVTIAVQPPASPSGATFSLPVMYQGTRYNLYFKGDAASYAQRQAQYQSVANGPQAQYLTAFLLGGSSAPITGVWVYSGGQPVTASNTTRDVLARALTWAYSYTNFVMASGGAQVQNEYNQFLVAYQNEAGQLAGIALANLANLATIIGPIMEDLSGTYGGQGVQQLTQFGQLLADAVQGSQQILNDYPCSGGAIISTLLQSAGLASATSYDPASLIVALQGTLQQNGSGAQIAQSLYSAAYSSACSPSAQPMSQPVATEASGFLSTLVQNLLGGAAGSALQGGSIFAEAYFQDGLTLATAGGAATTAAFGDILSCELPAAIGETIITGYIMPQAALLQEEVNIQNLLVNSAFPQFFAPSKSSMLVPQGGDQLADVSSGVAAIDALGLVYVFQSLWYTTDYQLLSKEDCIFCKTTAASDQFDSAGFETAAQQTLSLVQNAAALAGSMAFLSGD
jgi:uncharacterized protein (TIGR03437 family)